MSGRVRYPGYLFAPIPPRFAAAKDPLDSDEGEDMPETSAPPEFTDPPNAKASVIICVSTGDTMCKSHTAVQCTNEYVLSEFETVHAAQNKAKLNVKDGLLSMKMTNPVGESLDSESIEFARIRGDGVCAVKMALFVVLRPRTRIKDAWEMVHPSIDCYTCVYTPGWETEFQLHSGDIVMMFRKPAAKNATDMIDSCANVWYCLNKQLPPLDHLRFLMHSQQAVNSARAFLVCFGFKLNYPFSGPDDLNKTAYYRYRSRIPPPVITPQKPMPLDP